MPPENATLIQQPLKELQLKSKRPIQQKFEPNSTQPIEQEFHPHLKSPVQPSKRQLVTAQSKMLAMPQMTQIYEVKNCNV